MEAEEAENVYNVPQDRMPVINKQLEKVNRRAAKLGLPPVKLIELGRFTKEIKNQDGRKWDREYLRLRVDGEAPKVKGWTFVARIMHSEGGNIINTAPGMSPPPAKYRTAEPNCEHCKMNRRRNDTFVMRSEQGEYKQIGRNCLADFLGSADPAEQIGFFGDWNSVVQSLGDEDSDYYGGGSGSRTIEIVSYLTAALAVIRKFGFVPRSKSEDLGKPATSYILDSIFFGMSKDDQKLRDEVRAVKKPDDEDKAREILDWAKSQKNQEDVSDYLWNISAAAERIVVDSKTAGLVASIPAAYQRAMDKKVEKEKVEKEAESAPEVTLKPKDKFEGVLTVIKTPRWSNDYGLTVLHIMQDEHGRLYKWKASNEDIPVGSKVHIKGTVKAVGPDSYAGGKITVELTRCKVVKMHMGKEHQAIIDQKQGLIDAFESIVGSDLPAITTSGQPVSPYHVREHIFGDMLREKLAAAGVKYEEWRALVSSWDVMFLSKDQNFERTNSAEDLIRKIKASKDAPEADVAVKGLQIFASMVQANQQAQEIIKKLEGIYKVEGDYSGRVVHRESFLGWVAKRELI
jgi:hypothetical protein